jgi:hypothetical protein
MGSMQNVTPIAMAAFGLELAPAVLFGCAADRTRLDRQFRRGFQKAPRVGVLRSLGDLVG